jgi:hypothetical protein
MNWLADDAKQIANLSNRILESNREDLVQVTVELNEDMDLDDGDWNIHKWDERTIQIISNENSYRIEFINATESVLSDHGSMGDFILTNNNETALKARWFKEEVPSCPLAGGYSLAFRLPSQMKSFQAGPWLDDLPACIDIMKTAIKELEADDIINRIKLD